MIGTSYLEAQFAVQLATQEALRKEMATHHTLREAGIFGRRPSFLARMAAVVRRPITVGRANSPVGESAEAYGD